MLEYLGSRSVGVVRRGYTVQQEWGQQGKSMARSRQSTCDHRSQKNRRCSCLSRVTLTFAPRHGSEHTSGRLSVREGSLREQRAEVWMPVPGKAATPLNSHAQHPSVSSFKVHNHTATSCPQHIATCSQFNTLDTMLCLLYMNTVRGVVLALTPHH
jgi:hypothetical protein